MLQIGTKWQLWNLPNGYEQEIAAIKLRGYREDEPVALTGEILSQIREGTLRPLSVGDIVGYCPTHRDLFLRHKRGERGATTWGRTVGVLIEDYCKGIIRKRATFKQGPKTYKAIDTIVKKYTKSFKGKRLRQFRALEAHQTLPEHTTDKFSLLLEYTARYELAMLGADWILCGQRAIRSRSLLKRVPVTFDNITISPNSEILGIQSPATPDFLMAKLAAVGDIKSADAFKDLYYLTCTGYALAYENEHGRNKEINFGLIYFFETHTKRLSFASSYAFVIDDSLRREFLDRRNKAFQVLQSTTAPQFADREKYCSFCKYRDICAEDRDARTD